MGRLARPLPLRRRCTVLVLHSMFSMTRLRIGSVHLFCMSLLPSARIPTGGRIVRNSHRFRTSISSTACCASSLHSRTHSRIRGRVRATEGERAPPSDPFEPLVPSLDHGVSSLRREETPSTDGCTQVDLFFSFHSTTPRVTWW